MVKQLPRPVYTQLSRPTTSIYSSLRQFHQTLPVQSKKYVSFVPDPDHDPTVRTSNSALSVPGHLQLQSEENGFGIQDVLNYLKTQKISKCVVFDVASTVIYTDYIIMLTCPSTRAMQTLSMRLVKFARSMDNRQKHLVGGGDDPDGLWNIIELGNITVHLMTEEGRSSAVCQRVERRLMQNATLIPVSKWVSLEDSWKIRQRRLENDPPPQIKGAAPPGYYSKGADKAIPMDMEIISDPEEDEFDYLHVEDDHEARVKEMEQQSLHPGLAAEGGYVSSPGTIDVIASKTTVISHQAQQFLNSSILNESDSEESDLSDDNLSDDDLSDDVYSKK